MASKVIQSLLYDIKNSNIKLQNFKRKQNFKRDSSGALLHLRGSNVVKKVDHAVFPFTHFIYYDSHTINHTVKFILDHLAPIKATSQ